MRCCSTSSPASQGSNPRPLGRTGRNGAAGWTRAWRREGVTAAKAGANGLHAAESSLCARPCHPLRVVDLEIRPLVPGGARSHAEHEGAEALMHEPGSVVDLQPDGDCEGVRPGDGQLRRYARRTRSPPGGSRRAPQSRSRRLHASAGAPLTLLLGHPADPASTSSSDGSPKAAERSRYVPPTTRASHAGRGAPCDVRSFTPPAADTICSFESCEEPRADRIPRTRARSADVPPTMRVVGEAPAEAATPATTTTATTTSTADARARTRPSVLPSARSVRPGAPSRGWARRSGRCRVRGRSRPGPGRPRRRTVRSRGRPSPSTPPTPPPCR